MKTLIKNALIVNEGRAFKGSVLIDGEIIAAIYENYNQITTDAADARIIDASGKWLLPGLIDGHVHFREPGLTQKGDIASESRAAVAGGVTTFIDMPNTVPQTTTLDDLEWKYRRAAEVSAANYSFFFGATNSNAHLIDKLDRRRTPGIKLFLGSSTGNMLVDQRETLQRFFAQTDLLVAIHAEDETIINRNKARYIAQYGEDALDASFHPLIRSAEACYASSSEAVDMAHKYGTRLHLSHLSTEKELSLLPQKTASGERRITGEACVHHLWFCDGDYRQFGNRIKCNPAIKTSVDRHALRQAVNNDTIATIATDHAPHLLAEKQQTYLKAPSGIPLIQHSLPALLEMAADGVFTVEKIVQKTAHEPAELYRIDRRGYIRTGYYADLVIVAPDQSVTVAPDNILYKCKWSPFEGRAFRHSVWKTFVNGAEIYSENRLKEDKKGKEIVIK